MITCKMHCNDLFFGTACGSYDYFFVAKLIFLVSPNCLHFGVGQPQVREWYQILLSKHATEVWYGEIALYVCSAVDSLFMLISDVCVHQECSLNRQPSTKMLRYSGLSNSIHLLKLQSMLAGPGALLQLFVQELEPLEGGRRKWERS